MATYTVKTGDSLSLIAKRFYGNAMLYPRIARANGITAPYIIQPGQVLQIPGTTHTASTSSSGTAATMPVSTSMSVPASTSSAATTVPVAMSSSSVATAPSMLAKVESWVSAHKGPVLIGIAAVAAVLFFSGPGSTKRRARRRTKRKLKADDGDSSFDT